MGGRPVDLPPVGAREGRRKAVLVGTGAVIFPQWRQVLMRVQRTCGEIAQITSGQITSVEMASVWHRCAHRRVH